MLVRRRPYAGNSIWFLMSTVKSSAASSSALPSPSGFTSFSMGHHAITSQEKRAFLPLTAVPLLTSSSPRRSSE